MRNTIRRWFSSALGFLVSQPLHVSLRQMRLIQVFVILNSQALVWYICDIMIKLDSTQAAIGLSAVLLAEIAAIWKCVDSFRLSVVLDQNHQKEKLMCEENKPVEPVEPDEPETQGSTQTPVKE